MSLLCEVQTLFCNGWGGGEGGVLTTYALHVIMFSLFVCFCVLLLFLALKAIVWRVIICMLTLIMYILRFFKFLCD